MTGSNQNKKTYHGTNEDVCEDMDLDLWNMLGSEKKRGQLAMVYCQLMTLRNEAKQRNFLTKNNSSY